MEEAKHWASRVYALAMRGRLLILGLLAALALPGMASAQRIYRAPLYDALNSALEKAHALWGVEPCEGHYTVQIRARLNSVEEAAWSTPTGQDYASPLSTWTNCELRLLRAEWASDRLEIAWPGLCTAVLHGWGHLTGHGHSDEPPYPGQIPVATEEQAQVMEPYGHDDIGRCGWTPPR